MVRGQRRRRRRCGSCGFLAVERNGEPAAALESFAEGLRVLTPLFRALPEAHAALIQQLAGNYIRVCKGLGRDPDPELLGPVAEVLR